jgi:WXXGXW repeat (2 copies)
MKRVRRILTIVLSVMVVSAMTVHAGERMGIGIRIAPPAPRHEIVHMKGHAGKVWVAGNWKWNRHDARYVWIEGRWCSARHGYVWVDGRWMNTRNGWVYLKGNWKRI